MTEYPRREIERVRDLLHAREDVSEADAQALLALSDQIDLLGEARYSDQTHEFLLKRCHRLARAVGGLSEALEEREAAEELVRWINREYDNPETNKDYRRSLRMFGELVTDGEGKPASIEWIPGGYPRNYDRAPDPSKMFRWEDHIEPMLSAALNTRDRALIALAMDAGPRAGELYDLQVGRFADHDYGLQVTFENGKQGTRSPILIPSVPYVQQWLRDHPATNDPEAPLWTRLNRVDGLTNNRVRDVFKEVADRANIQLPSEPTPTRFRKSSASHLANQGVSQAHLEDHHGWKRGSSVAGRYIAVFGDANDREIARAHGVDVQEDEPDDRAPITCPRCERDTPIGEDTCVWCGQVTDQQALERIDEDQKEIHRQVLRFLTDHPELIDRVEDAEDVLAFLDNHPGVVDEATSMLAAKEN